MLSVYFHFHQIWAFYEFSVNTMPDRMGQKQMTCNNYFKKQSHKKTAYRQIQLTEGDDKVSAEGSLLGCLGTSTAVPTGPASSDDGGREYGSEEGRGVIGVRT